MFCFLLCCLVCLFFGFGTGETRKFSLHVLCSISCTVVRCFGVFAGMRNPELRGDLMSFLVRQNALEYIQALSSVPKGFSVPGVTLETQQNLRGLSGVGLLSRGWMLCRSVKGRRWLNLPYLAFHSFSRGSFCRAPVVLGLFGCPPCATASPRLGRAAIVALGRLRAAAIRPGPRTYVYFFSARHHSIRRSPRHPFASSPSSFFKDRRSPEAVA